MENTALRISSCLQKKGAFCLLPAPHLHVEKSEIQAGLPIPWVEGEGFQKMTLRCLPISLPHQEESELILEIRVLGMDLDLSLNLRQDLSIDRALLHS